MTSNTYTPPDPDALYQSFGKDLYKSAETVTVDADVMQMLQSNPGSNNSKNVMVSTSDIGSGVDSSISQAATGSYQAGKKDFTNTANGFIIGVDPKDGRAKFYVGNSTNYFNYDGSTLTLTSGSGNAIIIDFGASILLRSGGDVNFTSVSAPAAPTLALINTAGNLSYSATNSQYYYYVTFITASGETSKSTGVEINTSASGQQVTVTIPVSTSSAVTGRRIYRTKVMFNGDIPFANAYLLTTVSDNTTTTYTDNTADVSLTVPAFFNFSNTNSSSGKIKVDGTPILLASESNTFVGWQAGSYTSSGYYNTAVGYQALQRVTSGNDNTTMGILSMTNLTTGHDNAAYGRESLRTATTGNFNTAYGTYALFTTLTGSNNTSIGAESLVSNSTGSGNVALGFYAGYYETGSDAFYVNNQDRTNTAGDKAKSLLYGVFASTAAAQKLTLNGLLNLSVTKTPSSAADTGTAGDIAWDSSFIYVCTATNTWKRVGIATW